MYVFAKDIQHARGTTKENLGKQTKKMKAMTRPIHQQKLEPTSYLFL